MKRIYRLYIIILHVIVLYLFVQIWHCILMKEYFYVLQSSNVTIWINPGDDFDFDKIPDGMHGGLYFTPEEQRIMREKIMYRLSEECNVNCDLASVDSSVYDVKVVVKCREEIQDTRLALKIISEEFCKVAEKYVGKETIDHYFSDCSDWSYEGVMVDRGWIWLF